MFRWYVKGRNQPDYNERAKALNCDWVLEDTSSQVDPGQDSPHVIVQVIRIIDGESRYINEIFPEPTTLEILNSVEEDAEMIERPV